MLRGTEARLALDIQIGQTEAFAIGSALEGKQWERPMTHDLLRDVIGALGGTLQQVVIAEHRDDDVYIAEMELTDHEGHSVRVSARPSDALALALRLGAPIVVNEAVVR